MTRRRKLAIVLLLIIGGLFALAVIFRPAWSSDSAEAAYMQGDLSGTLAILERRQSIDADSVLLAANCLRQLGKIGPFMDYVRSMQADAKSSDAAALVVAMLRIQNGQVNDNPRALIDTLLSAGASREDAWNAVVSGILAKPDFEQARQLLEIWRTLEPGSPARAHLSAVHANLTGDAQTAETRWIDAIEQHPQYELSWLGLSEFYKRPPKVRFDKAELVLAEAAKRFPSNTQARLELAEVRRRLGIAPDSQDQVGLGANSQTELLAESAAQFDMGNYARAWAALQQAELATADEWNKLTDSAFKLALDGAEQQAAELSQRISRGAKTLSYSGHTSTAASVFSVAVDRQSRLRRLQDLNVQNSIQPRQELVDESNAIVSPAFTPDYPTLEQLAESAEAGFHPGGWAIYQARCAQCHGGLGDGTGPAAANLFPAPRSFRNEPMRWVSAENRLATDADLASVIRHGELNASMPAFKDLTEAEIADVIRVLREFARRAANQAAEAANASDKSAWIAERTQPSKALVVPDIGQAQELIDQGQSIFATAGCGACHTAQAGQNKNMLRMFDSLGRPILAPNLASDPFRGGSDAAALYKRIALGIPGTPHPALVGDPTSVKALVAYVLSIHKPSPAYYLSNRQRRLRAVGLSYLEDDGSSL